MIKLLATDLDGTLFYPKRRFSLMTKANQKFMADFYHAGGENVLVTGRGKRVSGKVQKKLGIPISVLGCNGAFVYEDGKYVTSHPMDKNALMDLYMKLRTNFGIIAWLVLDDTDEIKIAATNVGNWLKLGAFTMNFFNFTYSEKFIASEPRLIESIAKGTVYKIMPIFGITPAASDKASRAYVALQEKYKDKFTIAKAGQALEITAGGVNKARTLNEYIAAKGIKPDEVAVVGDSFNDLPLIEAFKNSFVMSSGEEEVKPKARYIIKSVSDIREYVLNEDKTLKDNGI